MLHYNSIGKTYSSARKSILWEFHLYFDRLISYWLWNSAMIIFFRSIILESLEMLSAAIISISRISCLLISIHSSSATSVILLMYTCIEFAINEEVTPRTIDSTYGDILLAIWGRFIAKRSFSSVCRRTILFKLLIKDCSIILSASIFWGVKSISSTQS